MAGDAISVAFQSPLNGECWWCPDDSGRGVVGRPMSRRVRTGDGAGQVHGYRGRQYTLVTATAEGLPTADRASDASLVQIWRLGATPGGDADSPMIPGRLALADLARCGGDRGDGDGGGDGDGDRDALKRRVAALEHMVDALQRENTMLRQQAARRAVLGSSSSSSEGDMASSVFESLRSLFDKSPPDSFALRQDADYSDSPNDSYFGARTTFLASFLTAAPGDTGPDALDALPTPPPATSRALADDVDLSLAPPESATSMLAPSFLFNSPKAEARRLGPPNRKRRASV